MVYDLVRAFREIDVRFGFADLGGIRHARVRLRRRHKLASFE